MCRDNMVKICLDIDGSLFEELKKQTSKEELGLDDLIEKYIQNGLIYNEVENMQLVRIPDDIMDKMNNRCDELKCNPEKLIHSILFDYLKKVESIPTTIDREKMMMLLEHDNPEGDDILDNLVRLGRQGWD